jgi:hypothetical protein
MEKNVKQVEEAGSVDEHSKKSDEEYEDLALPFQQQEVDALICCLE